MAKDIDIEELKSNLGLIGLDLETFSERKGELLNNDILDRYTRLQQLKVSFDEKKYTNNEYYDKLEFKSIVLNNKIKNIVNSRQKWLLEKSMLIKYYRKEIALADRYIELNKEVEGGVKELSDYIDKKVQDEYMEGRNKLVKSALLDYAILVGLFGLVAFF